MRGVYKILLPVMVIGLALLCHPFQVKASSNIYYLNTEGTGAYITERINNAKLQEILEDLPESVQVLSFEQEPKENLYLSTGNYNRIRFHYLSDGEESVRPRIILEGELQVEEVQLLGGNVLLATNQEIPRVVLGNAFLEPEYTLWEEEPYQNIVMDCEIQELYLLRELTDTDYCFSEESCEESENYTNYSGECFVEPNRMIQKVNIQEVYYDGIREECVSICKEQGTWGEDGLLLEKRRDWQETYNAKYTFEYSYETDSGMRNSWYETILENGKWIRKNRMDQKWNINDVARDCPLTLQENQAQSGEVNLQGDWTKVTIRSGTAVIDGDVQTLVIEEDVRLRSQAEALCIKVYGNVENLMILGNCVNSSVWISGTVVNGQVLSHVQGLDGKAYVQFIKSKDDEKQILEHGVWNENILLCANREENGVFYRMDTSLKEALEACEGDTVWNIISCYSRYANKNLGVTLITTSVSEEEKKYIEEQLLQDDLNNYMLLEDAFDLSLQMYCQTLDLLYIEGTDKMEDGTIYETLSPLKFTIRIPHYQEKRQYQILRIHQNLTTQESVYDLLTCTQDGEFLSFETDKFSKYVLLMEKEAEEEISEEPGEEEIEEEIPEKPEEEVVEEDIPEEPEEEEVEEATPEESKEEETPETPSERITTRIPSPQTGDPATFCIWGYAFLITMVGFLLMKSGKRAVYRWLLIPFVFTFAIMDYQGIHMNRGTFLLKPEKENTELALYQMTLDWSGIHKEEYWRFDLLEKYTNPQIASWNSDLIVFYQDDKKRLPYVYVEMDTSEDWIDLACPARGKNSTLEVDGDYIYVYTSKDTYRCDARKPLDGWRQMGDL